MSRGRDYWTYSIGKYVHGFQNPKFVYGPVFDPDKLLSTVARDEEVSAAEAVEALFEVNAMTNNIKWAA